LPDKDKLVLANPTNIVPKSSGLYSQGLPKKTRSLKMRERRLACLIQIG